MKVKKTDLQKEIELFDLKGRKFTEAEKAFLRKRIPKKNYKIKYCFWKQERKNEMYIAFVIDYSPRRLKACAADQALEVVSTRDLSEEEYNEAIENFGCCSRVMRLYNYKDVDWLIEEDLKYGIQTPQLFINECRKRGYTKTPDLFSFNYKENEL